MDQRIVGLKSKNVQADELWTTVGKRLRKDGRKRVLTNPTHVLDLGLVLPACVVAGFLLARRRPWGFVLGPYFLVNFAVLGVAIVSMTVFMLIDGQPFNVALSVVFSLWTLMSAALAWRLLSDVR